MFSLKILPKRLLKTACCCVVAFVIHLATAFDSAVLFADGVPLVLSSKASAPLPRKAVSVRAAKDKLPLYFIENRGQADPRVAYYVQGSNKIFYFTDEGITLVLSKPLAQQSARADLEPVAAESKKVSDSAAEKLVSRVTLKLDFVGIDRAVKPIGQELSSARISYFKGRREDWATDLKTYARLVYPDLWPGIDLVYSGTVDRLKYMFVVRPGADPKQIKLRYRGAESVSLDPQGRLAVRTALEDFHEDKPTAYQEIDGAARDVQAGYALESQIGGSHSYGFNVGDYDSTKALIIDPAILVYAGFIGGLADDRGNGIAVDSEGSAYITGETNSTQLSSFPVSVGPDVIANGGLDAFVAKVDPTGTQLLYAGFIGGLGDDRGKAIAVDSTGNAYVTGETTSNQASFPVTVGPDLTHNGLLDVFVAKVNASGTNLLYAGYIGGIGNDSGSGIAVDASNRAYITGETESIQGNFPTGSGFGSLASFDATHNGGLDAFVARIAANGASLEYAGFIGGIGTDRGTSIAVDSSNRAYVTGETDSTEASFPDGNGLAGLTSFDSTQNGDLDAFVVRIAADGLTFEYAGYIGGVAADGGNGITVDGAGAAYVTGATSSSAISFPNGNGIGLLPGPGQSLGGGVDAFVAKIDPTGSALVYAGFIGGLLDDRGNAIALMPGCPSNCEVYITGATSSTEATFPVSLGPDLSHNGGIDAFVAKVNASGSLGFAGYIGGFGSDSGKGIALDALGDVYITGETNSSQTTFPTKGGPDTTQNLGFDAFVAKICVTVCTDVSVSTTDTPDPVTVGGNVTYTITVTNNGPEGATDVELTDVLPSTVVLVSVTPSAGSCVVASTIVCDLGNLANGASATVIIVVSTTVSGSITNSVSVTSDETDTDLRNNINEGRTAVTLPDLTVKTISFVAAVVPGTDIVVNETTTNKGKVAAGPSVTRFYLSTDSKFDSGDLPSLGSRAIPALAPKQNNAGSTTLTIPLATAPGRYFLIGVADADSGVPEAKENNAKARALNVTQPDLIVQTLRVPSSAAAGASININDTTMNKAPVPAGGSTTNFYLSTDGIFDGSDVPLGSRSIPPLAAKGRSSGSTTVVIPLPTAPGKYFVLGVSDAGGAVTEIDEGNNLRSKSITVTP
ncbi:MAG TPA: SBBP repeat-containing protein [Candidatus Binatia bacterium]|nr:SBBP repeat-containing protein [Candidatus Binatia bacterium]